MATLTTVIMVGILCMGTAQESADQCDSPFEYDIQPRSMILGNDTQLILCCQVSTEPKPDIPDFSIQWHYSSIFPKIINKTSDTAVDYGQIHMNNTATFSRKTVWSKLTVDFKLGHTEGYYWCSVNINDTFYPSGVLNISTVAEIRLQACTCGDGPVTDNTQFSKFLCANSDFKKISDTCPHGDTGETTQATSVANDLRTTIPYDIGKNNTTTTHEVTESSTTSSTEVSTNNNSTNHHTSMEITTETSNNNKSTTHHIDMQITTENSYEDITQATNVADTEGLTTAETLEKDQLDRIMMSFTIGISTGAILSLITLLCLVIGICIMKISKMRAKRQKQEAEQAIKISTPVDVYNMTTKTKLVRKESALSTSFTCEPNSSYDVNPRMIRAPSLEHVYDCIP